MKPKRIFFVRHGQSQGNVDQKTHETIPDYKIPLTDVGLHQARDAGLRLRAILNKDPLYTAGFGRLAFYTSPYIRTRQTLTEFQKAFLPSQIERTREDPRLREQEWGHLRAAEATDAIDVERQAYGTFFYRIPDGESGADVYDRCSGFLDTIHRDFEHEMYPEDVVVITHGFTMRVMLKRWLHWTVEQFHELANPANCSIYCIERDDSEQGRRRYQLVGDFPKRDASNKFKTV